MAQRFASDIHPEHHMHLCLLQNVANAASVRSSLAGGAVSATVLKARMVD